MFWTILRKERQIATSPARPSTRAGPRIVRIIAGLLVCTAGLPQEPVQPPFASPPTLQSGLPVRPSTEAPALPQEVAELKLPDSFTWVETTRQQGSQNSTTTRFKTSLSPELSRAVAQAALVEAGWKRDQSSALREIFINPDRPDPLSFCRNDRWISLSPSGSAGNSEVIFAIPARSRSCDAARLPEGVDASLALMSPTLEGPSSAASPGRPAAFSPAGGMYGPDTASSWAQFRYGDLGDAASQFANQLASQGWKREASWNGPSTAGSSWSMQVDDQTVLGRIQLLGVGRGEFFVDFTMVRASRARADDQPWKHDATVLTRLIFGAPAGQAVQVTRQIPAGSLGFGVPPQFELVGTASPRPDLKATAFRTFMPIADARDALLEAMMSEGWIREGSSDEEALFLISNRTRFEILCRSADRRIIRVHEIDEARYVVISALGSDNEARRECQASGRVASPADSNVLRSNLPKLAFPESARSVPGEGVLDMSLNGRILLHRTLMRSADTPAAILQHLAPQLVKLGWERDIEWSGSGSAGSNWRRNADGPRIWTNLVVTSLGNELFEVRLQALRD